MRVHDLIVVGILNHKMTPLNIGDWITGNSYICHLELWNTFCLKSKLHPLCIRIFWLFKLNLKTHSIMNAKRRRIGDTEIRSRLLEQNDQKQVLSL